MLRAIGSCCSNGTALCASPYLFSHSFNLKYGIKKFSPKNGRESSPFSISFSLLSVLDLDYWFVLFLLLLSCGSNVAEPATAATFMWYAKPRIGTENLKTFCSTINDARPNINLQLHKLIYSSVCLTYEGFCLFYLCMFLCVSLRVSFCFLTTGNTISQPRSGRDI